MGFFLPGSHRVFVIFFISGHTPYLTTVTCSENQPKAGKTHVIDPHVDDSFSQITQTSWLLLR